MSFFVRLIAPDQSILHCAEFADGEQVLLSDVLHLAGMAHDMPCGGRGVCGKCVVTATGALSPLTDAERQRFGASAPREGSRLACCARALGDVSLYYNTDRANMQGLTQGFLTNFSLSPPDGCDGTGLAVDVGTTTVALYLYSLRDGRLLGSLCRRNPQRTHGADVISRVDHALHGGAHRLQALILDTIDQAEAQLCAMTATSPPVSRVITGNTAMLHLLTATDPSPLAAAPFALRRHFGETVTLREHPVYLPRCISAFVGADMTAALLASGLDTDDNTTALLMDIGTNGEMALLHHGEWLCCSTAAGPALEGAGISCGAMAEDGAIDRVCVKDGALHCHKLGAPSDAPAIGLCGTGLIDAAAALLALGVLEESGYMEEDADVGGCLLTRGDIRQLQLAKAAIRAGLETLLHVAGIGYDALDRVAIAGGFGSYLRPESCAAIGLIPRELIGKLCVLGNAAGSGAAMMLLSAKERAHAESIASRARVVDLSTNPFFMERYVEEMYF